LPILAGSPQPPPKPTLSTPAPTKARHILVVDDNRDSADSLAMLLKLTGHETHTAHDGVAAVEAAATLRPDIVLLDIGLPNLSGYDAARRIRKQPWGKDMVLIALTGWGQEEDRQRSREAGFNEHMVKPVDHVALMKLLAESGAS
jgi:CheY-like chemotaxis protein